jgi:hypothetical protein
MEGEKELTGKLYGLTAAFGVYKLYSLLIIILSKKVFVAMTLTNGSLSRSGCKNSRLEW